MKAADAASWRDKLTAALDAARRDEPDAIATLKDEVARAGGVLREDSCPPDLRDLAADAERLLAERSGAVHVEAGRRRLNSLDPRDLTGTLNSREALTEIVWLAEAEPGSYEAGLRALRERGALKADVDTLKRTVREHRKAQQRRQKQRRREASDDGLPRIVVNGRPDRHTLDEARQIIENANTPPRLFQRSGTIVRVRPDERGRHLIEHVRADEMRVHLNRVANTVIERDGDYRHVTPPGSLLGDLLADDRWRLPPLEAVIEAPALRPDGTIINAPGYDPATRVVHAPAAGLTVPPIADEPTAAEIAAAVALLLELVDDFPFDSQGSHAAALALLLTPIVRPAIAGQVPLCLITAPQQGSGKSFLVSLVALITTGRAAAVMAAPAREEEWQKAILAHLLDGPALVAIDNVHGTLRSAALDLALTNPSIRQRILGLSETVEVPQRATWVATGNNLRIGGDLGRRSYRVRLDPKHARPWQREFRKPDLLGWATQHRGDLLHALLTIARAWYAAGQPAAPSNGLGGFNEWATTVGGVLHHAGIPGFLSDLDRHYDEIDEEAAEWETFLRAWHATYSDEPVMGGTIARALQTDGHEDLRDALPGDLADVLHKPGASFVRVLGKALAARADRRHGTDGIHLSKAGENTRSKAVLWRVVVPHEAPQVSQVSQVSLHRYAGEKRDAHIGESRVNGSGARTNLPNLPNLQGEATP